MTENTQSLSATGTYPLPPLSRPQEVAELLVGAVDLHCHSGPAAMPRILDHVDALEDAAAAGFRALLYKDHFYPGMAHAAILERLFPEKGVRLFSGIALNNASGGINPYAVDHAVKIGAKIVWMPTLSAANHIAQTSGAAKNFPKTAQKMKDPSPLTTLDANGRLTDEALEILDMIAAADVILAGGHLIASELAILFEEARRRGVRKLLVNHPTYLVGCSDEDIRGLVSLGATMEHSICMFVPGKAYKYDGAELHRLIEVAGVANTVLCSDLGLQGSQRPVDGYRSVVQILLDSGFGNADIRRLISTNAAALLNLDTGAAEARVAAE